MAASVAGAPLRYQPVVQLAEPSNVPGLVEAQPRVTSLGDLGLDECFICISRAMTTALMSQMLVLLCLLPAFLALPAIRDGEQDKVTGWPSQLNN